MGTISTSIEKMRKFQRARNEKRQQREEQQSIKVKQELKETRTELKQIRKEEGRKSELSRLKAEKRKLKPTGMQRTADFLGNMGTGIEGMGKKVDKGKSIGTGFGGDTFGIGLEPSKKKGKKKKSPLGFDLGF